MFYGWVNIRPLEGSSGAQHTLTATKPFPSLVFHDSVTQEAIIPAYIAIYLKCLTSQNVTFQIFFKKSLFIRLLDSQSYLCFNIQKSENNRTINDI